MVLYQINKIFTVCVSVLRSDILEGLNKNVLPKLKQPGIYDYFATGRCNQQIK